MSRSLAIEYATEHFETGRFLELLDSAVAHPTESQESERLAALYVYLSDFIAPQVQALGFEVVIHDNPVAGRGPFMIASRVEGPGLPTLLSYGHGDVVRGYDAQWREGLEPWKVVVEGERWYGRGTADNKGQHLINLTALEQVIRARGGQLGFNVKLLLEMGEETGSPGLRAFCAAHKAELAADVFIASDGPRLNAARPTLFLGSRGAFNFELSVELREGAHHSGNWGGLLANPGIILANAIASMVDQHGRVKVAALKPRGLPAAVKAALSDIEVGGGPDDPAVDPDWGEPGLSASEKVFGWNTLEVLAFKTGNPDAPVHAIPGTAWALCHVRFTVDSDFETFIPAVRAHLDAHGFDGVKVTQTRMEVMHATRLDPASPWVGWAMDSLRKTTAKPPALLPNLGGSLPNDVFADVLGLPTVWVPHSYPACSQHAPDEHVLAPVVKESLQIMAGMFWDLGEDGARLVRECQP
ncbi:M20 family metallopeptidase [Pseudomonas typographi]|uniref:M20 family metallopeptidase n=1 Tax=Pseudomonas typographi TaxID=2715964 RepID=UPI001685D7D2|nr:M20 family metallopeptidase [Pseudomonas typographi]MBD1552877.1 M20 family metallopeptidase [Pseudomonas typographi]MBD1588252.1 M20 family metallopeptidase [Pseudomonas typographi]